VKTLVSEGPMAAWEQLKEMGEELKRAFVSAVTDWIKWKVVEEAVKTVLALFIPGAGMVRAIVAIYDTIVFFIQKARDIMQMIGSFLGSIAEIAAGNIGAAADALELGLARGLKLVIAFLAKFLRLDGITARIRTALEAVRNKVNAVLDKVASWVVGLAKKAGKLGKDGEATVDGTRNGTKKSSALPDTQVRKPFTMAGLSHSITVIAKDGEVHVIMASDVASELRRLAQHAFDEVNDPKLTPQFSEEERRDYRVHLLDLRDEARPENVNAAYALAGKPPGVDQWVSQYVTGLIEHHLVPLAARGVKSITTFVRSVPDVRYLPVEFQDGDWIRDNLYVSSADWRKIKEKDDPGERLSVAKRLDQYNATKRTSIWDELQLAPDGMRGYLIPSTAIPGSYSRSDVFTQKMARDHVLPLAQHWAKDGYSQTDNERDPVARGTGEYRLELITAEYNSRKQALGHKYRWDINGTFASVRANSPVKSWKIKGRPFLRTASGPPVTQPAES
jgi:hypothetical protein